MVSRNILPREIKHLNQNQLAMKQITFFIAFIFISFQVNAQVITVKQDGTGDFTVIQDAIEAAKDGDTVLVHEGTYYEHINFLGKKITVGSLHLTNPQNPFHVVNTILDGSIPARADSNSVVHFVSGEDTTSILHGFTIQNGNGTVYKGGGILVYNSGAKIVHNRIIDNQVLPSGYGGGIYASCYNFSPDNWVIIEHNTIENDSLYGSFQHYGAGICANMNARIRYNIIQNNDINAPPAAGTGAAIGGGIYCDLYSYSNYDDYYTAEISDNIIKNNTLFSTYTQGGGVFAYGGKVMLTDNTIENNLASSGTYTTESSAGGGAIIGWFREGTEIIGNTFEGNSSEHPYNYSYGGGLNVYSSIDSTWSNIPLKIEKNIYKNNSAGHGGGLRLWCCNMQFQNNFLNGNTGWIRGSAMVVAGELEDPDSVMKIINNTIVDNSHYTLETMRLNTFSKVLVMNNIIYDTTTSTEISYKGDQQNLQVHYNLIDETKIGDPFTGSHNMFNDPELKFGSYEFVDPTSTACLDAGTIKLNIYNHDFECPEDDIEGNPRPQSGASEIGALELLFSDISDIKYNDLKVSISPNPFHQTTTISFTAGGNHDNYVGLFDIAGNKVLERTFPCNGNALCELEIDGNRLSPGIYLVKIITGRTTRTAKLVVSR